ncbi:unnamed protein product [Thlaspi arvense]|uniref:Uncharacterized protein n=1 Tax=Thlaspi arvense TaxID=13288 RepID=A0AAU9RUJ3_THLAR|nr:unnamed protein product [Thlaspi arvense]
MDSLWFTDCYKLGREARRVITQQSSPERTFSTGWEIPAEFHHRALGNSWTISSSFYRFRVCVVVTPKPHTKAVNFIEYFDVLCRISLNGCPIDEQGFKNFPRYIRGIHLGIFYLESLKNYGWLEQDNEIFYSSKVNMMDQH